MRLLGCGICSESQCGGERLRACATPGADVLASTVHRFFCCNSPPQFGQHVPFAEIPRPSRPQSNAMPKLWVESVMSGLLEVSEPQSQC